MMMEIMAMKAEHIDEVLEVEETCFHIPWTKADFKREINENKMAIYRVVLVDGKIVGSGRTIVWNSRSVGNGAHAIRVVVRRQMESVRHQDFAEDTFRTLTAVDSVIIVIDIAKGVEAQTRKLMEVCRMRKTPVIVFVNKMDRDGKDPFDLLDEIEEELQIKVRPLSWPIDMGQRFRGVYNIFEQKLNLYTPSKQYVTENVEFK